MRGSGPFIRREARLEILATCFSVFLFCVFFSLSKAAQTNERYVPTAEAVSRDSPLTMSFGLLASLLATTKMDLRRESFDGFHRDASESLITDRTFPSKTVSVCK